MAAKVIEFKRKSGTISGYAIDLSGDQPLVLGLMGTLHGDVVTVPTPDGKQVRFIMNVSFFDSIRGASDAIEMELDRAINGYKKMLRDFQQKRRIQSI